MNVRMINNPEVCFFLKDLKLKHARSNSNAFLNLLLYSDELENRITKLLILYIGLLVNTFRSFVTGNTCLHCVSGNFACLVP